MFFVFLIDFLVMILYDFFDNEMFFLNGYFFNKILGSYNVIFNFLNYKMLNK